jgi:hypothetical protein
MIKTDPLLIDYKSLGTIALDEFKQALWDDIQALHEEFGISFVQGAKLIVPATNEYGDPVSVKRLSNGQRVSRLDTHHYRPACMDYKL